MNVIEVSHIDVARNGRTILSDVSLTIGRGQFVSIIGPNGCGKSTLLKAMCRMLPLSAGNITVFGRDVQSYSRKELARHIAFLTQTHDVPAAMTVRDLVFLGRFPYRSFYGGSNADDIQKVDRALSVSQMTDYADRPVHELSGGEQQRAWLAVMLAQATPVLFLDEPTTYLDIHHQLHMIKLLRHIHEKTDRTIVIVLHDMNQAIQYTDHTIVMEEGCVVAQGTPAEVITPTLLRDVFAVTAETFQSAAGKPVVHAEDIVRETYVHHKKR